MPIIFTNMNYILIISDETDFSTNQVIDWLSFMGHSFLRINNTDILNVVEFNINSNKINIQLELESYGIKKNIYLHEIKSVWYRRGKINLSYSIFKHKNKDIQNGVNIHLYEDKIYIENFINQYLLSKKHINSFIDNSTNKLHNLFLASSVGLKIPSTVITTNKSIIQRELYLHKKLITKAITNGAITFNPKLGAIYQTNLIEQKQISNISDFFSASLIQTCIDKAYELRIFYLNDKFYSMAIFSQNDERTKIDFRNYNYEKPNRTIPYKLPLEIQNKLLELTKKIKINCGSIDIIVSNSKEYFFLEINPIGQFQQTSYPCNYFIEKKIAHYLI